LAQNENETVGFQNNHAFDSGHFGENIDILNGNLSLTVPIAPSYQINQNFGYQLSLSYNSKVWDTARYTEQGGGVDLSRRSAVGLGFSMNFGRIYRDVQTRGGHNWYAWYYVSPDGNEHDLGVTSAGCTKPPRTITNGNGNCPPSQVLINSPGCAEPPIPTSTMLVTLFIASRPGVSG